MPTPCRVCSPQPSNWVDSSSLAAASLTRVVKPTDWARMVVCRTCEATYWAQLVGWWAAVDSNHLPRINHA